jgi:hypothetical protein
MKGEKKWKGGIEKENKLKNYLNLKKKILRIKSDRKN